MRGEPKYANANIVVKVIRRPRSGFEQYEALRVCQDLIGGDVSSGELKAIRDAIAVADANASLRNDADRSRWDIADQILKAVPAGQRGD